MKTRGFCRSASAETAEATTKTAALATAAVAAEIRGATWALVIIIAIVIG